MAEVEKGSTGSTATALPDPDLRTQDGTPGQEEDGGGEKPPEQPDYKALYEESEQARKSIEGSQRGRETTSTRFDAMDSRFDRLEKLFAIDPNLSTEERDAKIAAHNTEATVAQQAQAKVVIADLGVKLDDLVKETEGLELTDPRLKGALGVWELAKDRDDVVLATTAEGLVRDVAEQIAAAKAAPKKSAADLALNPGGAGGGGESDQAWLNKYSDEVNGGIPATPKNAERAKELKAKGLIPKPL